MKSLVLLRGLVGILLGASPIYADYPSYTYDNEYVPTGGVGSNQSIDYVAPLPHKYDVWYAGWGRQLEIISEGVCNLSLAAFRGDIGARTELGVVGSYCRTHGNCILSTITPDIAQSMAGASILLGLTPTILSLVGPSVAEMALLSMHRPILSSLLSLGAPAIYPGRFLIWEDPLQANRPKSGAFSVMPFSRPWPIVVSGLEYIVALGAVGNIVHNAYTIGVRAVLVWYCDESYWPLLWVVLGLVIHITAALSLRLAMRRKPKGSIPDEQRPAGGLLAGAWAAMKREVTPSANSSYQVRDHYSIHLGPLAVLLQYVGALCALVHLVFGTAMFSSLLYIGNTDAISLIMRFVASAVFSRFILQFEIGGMTRVPEGKGVWNGIVQPGTVRETEGEGDAMLVEIRSLKGTR
jgi:hypothetical protein